MQNTTLNLRLISEEINLVLSSLYSKYISEGRPTKRGGLRFLDIESKKTFGFEKTHETDTENLLILSAPFSGALEDIKKKSKLEKKIGEGPHGGEIHDIVIRQSRDKGKEDKNFVEVKYRIPTRELLEESKIEDYGKKYKNYNSKFIVKCILRENVEPFAESTMNHLIKVICNFD